MYTFPLHFLYVLTSIARIQDLSNDINNEKSFIIQGKTQHVVLYVVSAPCMIYESLCLVWQVKSHLSRVIHCVIPCNI